MVPKLENNQTEDFSKNPHTSLVYLKQFSNLTFGEIGT
jgi:hypothetical protein